MNTGIQYTTEWTYVRTVNGNEVSETCRLVKLLNSKNSAFYTNAEVMNMDTDEYRQAFDNTVAYMRGLGWESVPTFDDSCKTNTEACPVALPVRYSVVPLSFVCQTAIAAAAPLVTVLSGWKFASVFQYRINGVQSSTVRLVKTFDGDVKGVTFYSDAEIANMLETDTVDSIQQPAYRNAFNRTLQYMTYLGWLATPDINVCRLVDRVSCPLIGKAIHIDALKFYIIPDEYYIQHDGGTMYAKVAINGKWSDMALVYGDLEGEEPVSYIKIEDVDLNMGGLNIIQIKALGEFGIDDVRITTSIDNDAVSAEITDDIGSDGDDHGGIMATISITAEALNNYTVVNNGERSFNLDAIIVYMV